jgi:hypothetical protein
MNPRIKEKRSKPFRLIKALFGCMVLFFIPALFITFTVPSFTIELTQVNQERVDATVLKNLIFILPVSKYTVTNLVKIESETIDGGLIGEGSTGEAEDEGLLLLKGVQDESIEVYISPRNLDAVEEEVQYFITESKEPFLRLWVVSNWKFGVVLPGGILLFGLAAFLSSVWAIITGQPLRSDGAIVKEVQDNK